MRLAKTVLVVFGSSQLSTIVGFIATFYIARFLGPATLGTYAVVTALLFWVHVPASAIDSALMKRISEGINRGEFLSAGLIISGAVAILVTLGFIVFEDQVNAYLGASVSRTVAVLALSWFTAKWVSSTLRGEDKVAAGSLVWTSGRIVRTTLQIALVGLLGLGLSGLIWGHAVSFFAVTVVGAVMLDTRPRFPSREQFYSLWEYARYAWLGRISSQAFNWMDTVVLGFFVSSSLIGIYEVAWTTASTFAIVSTAITDTLFPSMSRLDAQDRREGVEDLLNQGLVFAGFFAIPGLFGAFVIGTRVLEIFGPAFGQGWIVLLILITTRLSSSFTSQFKNTVNALDRPDLGFRINAGFLLTNLVLNLSLIPSFGWVGAAVATFLSSFLAFILSYYYVNSILSKVVFPMKEIGKEIVASLVMIVPVYLLNRVVSASEVTTVGIVFIGAVVYTIVILGISSRIRWNLLSLLPERLQYNWFY